MHDALRVTRTGTQELVEPSPKIDMEIQREKLFVSDSHAKKPSSSSLRLGAGKGAPGASWVVGSLT